MQDIAAAEATLLESIIAAALPSAEDFGRIAAVCRQWRTVAETKMDWRAAYVEYQEHSHRINAGPVVVPWLVMPNGTRVVLRRRAQRKDAT